MQLYHCKDTQTEHTGFMCCELDMVLQAHQACMRTVVQTKCTLLRFIVVM